MPLPEPEIRRLFDKLATQLRERGAATLVDQVIDEITQGKQIIYKTVPRRRETPQLFRPESTDRGRSSRPESRNLTFE
jgi:2-C-methyl-D-erythritol 4-phosphate cytidylyltransferase